MLSFIRVAVVTVSLHSNRTQTKTGDEGVKEESHRKSKIQMVSKKGKDKQLISEQIKARLREHETLFHT